MKSFYLQWHILNRCNLRCIHCYQDDFTSKEELPFDDLLRVYENLIKSMEILKSRLNVALTGGEPLLHKNLFDLMERMEKEGRISGFYIITNGHFLPEFSRDLKKFKKLKDVKVSLDGFSEKENDKIRGKGSFKKAIEGIEELKGNKIETILMFTIMKSNKGEIKNLIPFMKSFGLKGAIVERFIPLGQGLKIKDEILSYEDWKNVCLEILRNLKIEVDLKNLSPYKAFKIEWKGKELELLGSECIVGRDGGALMPKGDFYPCRRFPLPQGNLLYKNLKEIFEASEILKKFKDKKNLKGKCGNCKFKNCIGCRAYVYSKSGDLFGEDEVCFLEY